MKTPLILLPIIIGLLSFYLYRFQDKQKRLFNLDFVQFIYLFVVAPTLFIWLKTLLFFLLKNSPELNLTINQIFIFDSGFTFIGLLVMAVLAIHSLTKTFWLRRHFDPQFDVFQLSEYFHLWWSHVSLWTGVLVLFNFLSIINLIFPFPIPLARWQWVAVLILAVVSGFAFFISLIMSDSQIKKFMRLMKLILAGFFLLHAVIYFLLDPGFNSQLAIYWFDFFFAASAVTFASFFPNNHLILKIKTKLLHQGWGENEIFPS